MSFKDYDRKTYIADLAGKFARRGMTKREFLRKSAMAGVGFSSFAAAFLGGVRPFNGLTNLGTPLAMANTPDDVAAWLKDAGKPFAGHDNPLHLGSDPADQRRLRAQI